MAAGFGSLRRFNETFQALFDRPPRALRREGRATTPAGSAVTLGLGYKSPYDWEAMLAFLRLRAIPGVERAGNDDWTRAIDIGGRAGWVTVSHDPDRRRLVARLTLPDWKALPSVVARLRRLFDLAADPSLIAPALGEDARLKPLVAARPGLRVPGCWDGFELAVRAILGQQISVSAAIALAGKITEAHGVAIPAGAAPEGLTRLFPTAQALAKAEIGGMPRSRAAAINALAQSALENPRLFDREASLEDSLAKLKALKGVGDWTAHYIAMRALREPDAFPAADIGLMRALDHGAGRPDAATLEDWSQVWRPWRAYAAQHLWTSDSHLEKPRELAA